MQLQLVDSEQDLAGLRQDWNRLAGGNPLLSWEWASAWWAEFGVGNRLAIVVCRTGGRVTAIAPWFRSHRLLRGATLSFLGSGKACTDYQRILVDPQMALADLASLSGRLLELLRSCKATSGLDLIDLEGMTAGELATGLFVRRLAEAGYSVTSHPLPNSWVVELGCDWPQLASRVHRSFRRKLKKAARQATNASVSFHRAESPDEITAAWPSFVWLHQQRMAQSGRGPGCFSDPRFERFLRAASLALAERGSAELYWCEIDGQPASVQLHLRGPETAYMYQSGFDPALAAWEPGHLLYYFVVRGLIDEGCRYLDFLRGDEPYKADWTARPVVLSRLRCVAPRASSRLRHSAIALGRKLKRVAAGRPATPPPKRLPAAVDSLPAPVDLLPSAEGMGLGSPEISVG